MLSARRHQLPLFEALVGMNRPGIEPQFPGPLENTLTIMTIWRKRKVAPV